MGVGLFISFEGIDKSGKSTQAQLLAKYLQETGRDVVLTREPGGTALGKEIRHLVLTWKPQGIVDSNAEMFLFAADRAQHVAEVIKPGLEAGKVVITDRYVDSTLAYQGFGRELGIETLQHIQHIATGGLLPDLTVWVDVDLETAKSRYGDEKADRMESADEAMFERVREGYKKLSLEAPNRFLRVDGKQEISDIFEIVKQHVDNRLG